MEPDPASRRPPLAIPRREFIRAAGVGTAGLLAACSSAAPPTTNNAVVVPAAQPAAPSAPRPTEWTVVLGEQTGGGDPLTEYSTSAEYYLQKHVLEGLLHVELLPDGK